jgi:hypothetical protein
MRARGFGAALTFSTSEKEFIPVRRQSAQAAICVSRLGRLLIFVIWPRRSPFSGAEKSPIAFICELKKQIGIGLVIRREGQPAVPNCAAVAHSFSGPVLDWVGTRDPLLTCAVVSAWFAFRKSSSRRKRRSHHR